MNEQSQHMPMDKKIERLNKIYISTFEYIKKNSSKKDPKFQEIKDCCVSLKDFSNNFSTYEQIRTYSLILSTPPQSCNNKGIEKIITAFEEIININLLEQPVLQETILRFIQYLKEPKEEDSRYTDDSFNVKILNFFILIYTCDQIAIHGDYVKFMIKICLAIYLSNKSSQYQSSAALTLSRIVDHLMKKINIIYNQTQGITGGVSNKTFIRENSNFLSKETSSNNSDITHKENIYPMNEYQFISKQYINFINDLIEIKNLNEINKKIIDKYISIISSSNQSKTEVRKELEDLNLAQYEKSIKNEIGAPIGKFGWCVFCRNTANAFSKKVNFPVCTNNECESEFFKIGLTIDNEYKFDNNLYRKDYIKILKYLSKTSSLEQSSGEAEIVRKQCREFCLKFMKQMIDQGYTYFTNDSEMITIIGVEIIGSLVKSTLFSDITVLTSSLDLFLVITKRFREHLKEQIEIFINKVMIAILESENLTMEYKEVVLNELLKMADDCLFLVEIYVNYDCDVNYKTVFYDLINILTKIIYGLYRKPQYANTLKPLEERKLRIKCLDFLTKFIVKLSDEVEKNDYERNPNNIKNVDVNESVYQDNTEEMSMSILEPTILGELKDKIYKNLQIKALLTKAINKFISNGGGSCLTFLKIHRMIYNEETFNKYKQKYIEVITSPNGTKKAAFRALNEYNEDDLSSLESSEQINIMETPFISNINSVPFLLQPLSLEEMNTVTYDDFTAFEMARFLRSNLKELKRDKLGNYLCSGKDFNKKVAKYFIFSFNFKGLHVMDALRVMFEDFPLVGEGQIIARLMLIFGEKYYKDNPNFNADLAYYVAFSILMLNTDLHRDEVTSKMTCQEFIKNFQDMAQDNRIDQKYLEDCYNRVRDNPLIIPGQKLNTNSKNKQELIKQEKENIISSVERLSTRALITNNYIKEIDNDNIKQLIECSWSNFLGIFSQLLADFDDEKVVTTCISNILRMAGTCGILHLDTIEEAFIKTITNATNVMEGREINGKNLKCIEELIDFVINYGKNIRKCWYIILIVLSKIDFYYSRQIDTDLFAKEIRKKAKLKNPEKELEIEIKNYELLRKYKFDLKCDTIFSKTTSFEKDSILNFIQSLCLVSTRELEDYATPRVYSLHKLVEVCDFNIFRIQIEWVQIWKLISEFLVKVITESQQMNIWTDALDLLRQTIGKLLQKPDLSVYNFQMDFFKPFENILSKVDSEKGDVVLQLIYYIVGTYTKNIHSGWIVIFNILKIGLKKKNKPINEQIKMILQKINEDLSASNTINPELFRGYIECLSHMYLEPELKQYAFDGILNLLTKINEQKKKNDSKKNNEEDIKKKLELFKIFFYGFDDLMTTDVTEHLNLLFEIITQNKQMIFSSDSKSFLNAYYSYFKPHLVFLILFFTNFRSDYYTEETNELIKDYHKIETNDDINYNVKLYLARTIKKQIDSYKNENSNEFKTVFGDIEENKEKKASLISYLKKIQKSYEEDNDLFIKKIKVLSNFDEKNYEKAIELFLEKVMEIFSQVEDTNLNYNYFYEDLLQVLLSLSIFSKFSGVNYRILFKLLTESKEKISQTLWISVSEHIMTVLSLLATTKVKIEGDTIKSMIYFSSSFITFILSLFESVPDKIILKDKINLNQMYRNLSKVVDIQLQIDLENEFPDYKIVSNKETIDLLLSIQILKKFIIEKIEHIDDLYDSSCITCLGYFGKLFKKYSLSSEEDTPLIQVIQFELDTLLPKFLKFLNEKELRIVFDSLIDFIESKNANLRSSAKQFLKQFVSNKLCKFIPYSETHPEEKNKETKE